MCAYRRSDPGLLHQWDPLLLQCALMYLRILFCCSIVQVEIEAHHWECKVTEHISTKSPIFGSLSLSESVCSLYLSISPLLSLSLSLLHTSAAVSFLFIHSTSHEQTAPWMPWPEIRWNSHNSLPDCKISASQSGLGDSELLFISVERFDHILRLRTCIMRVQKGKENLHHAPFLGYLIQQELLIFLWRPHVMWCIFVGSDAQTLSDISSFERPQAAQTSYIYLLGLMWTLFSAVWHTILSQYIRKKKHSHKKAVEIVVAPEEIKEMCRIFLHSELCLSLMTFGFSITTTLAGDWSTQKPRGINHTHSQKYI